MVTVAEALQVAPRQPEIRSISDRNDMIDNIGRRDLKPLLLTELAERVLFPEPLTQLRPDVIVTPLFRTFALGAFPNLSTAN